MLVRDTIEIEMKNVFQKTMMILLLSGIAFLVQAYKGYAQSATTTQTASGQVDIIVEPTSYVPPFYPGKAIFTTQGTARIIAIPNVTVNGTQANSKNLIFDWQQDGLNLSIRTRFGR